MASTKVGDGLSYQVAVRWVMECPFLQGVGGPGGPGKEPQQDGSGAGDGPVGPLALGLHAQMGPRFLKGDLSARGGPAQEKPFNDLDRVRCWVGAE